MSKTFTDLPDDVVIDLFENYLSNRDLIQLGQVCRRFRTITNSNLIWSRLFKRNTNVAIPYLKNHSSCPILQDLSISSAPVLKSTEIPENYQYFVASREGRLFDERHRRRSTDSFNECTNINCDVYRLFENYRQQSILSNRWCAKENLESFSLVQFRRRAQTSVIQYDEHHHCLWFNHYSTLQCLNLRTNTNEYQFDLTGDDILTYKVFSNDVACIGHGKHLRLVLIKTGQIIDLPTQHENNEWINGRPDILSLDIFSNDHQRYQIISGSRSKLVSLQTFDRSDLRLQPIWSTIIDDCVYCSRFSVNGNHFLVGTGGRTTPYPVVLFDVERPEPLHAFDGNYKQGAGVRCIEWASENVFLAAGFDAQFKEFDLRTGKCHYTYYDEYDNDYFSMCVPTDPSNLSNSVILGGNHHSTVRFFNRRQRRTEKIIFPSKQPSPVHSLAATPEYLFVSLDRSIELINFTNDQHAIRNIKLKL